MSKYIVIILYLLSVVGLKSAAQQNVQLEISLENQHELAVSKTQDAGWEIITSGSDPYLFTKPLTTPRQQDENILTFDYFCPSWLDHLQIFFAPPVKDDNSLHTELGVAEGWTTFSIDIKEFAKSWGKAGDFLRLDFGSAPNYRMQIKNIHLRKPDAAEQQQALTREKNKLKYVKVEEKLKNYLSKIYISALTNIVALDKKITIAGNVNGSKNLFLAEVPLYQEIAELSNFENLFPIQPVGGKFKLVIDRLLPGYDRILSKWVIVEKKPAGYELKSHARYTDSIQPLYNLPPVELSGKKGLGGFNAGGKAPVSDLESLGITSATVNIWITKFIRSAAGENNLPFTFNGKIYYVDRKAVDGLDKTLRLTSSKNIAVAAIILIDKAKNCPDPEMGKIFEHPDFDPAGIYSMANVTSAIGVEYYAAIIDFLAKRYSQPDRKYGRIDHWIMHNEVDAGWVWTNMGEKTPLLFMDDYHKSMRVVYNIARKYNQFTKVFISLTHYWAWTSDRHYYHSDDLLNILLDYSKKEGDFDWAIAQHPYPESLFEPKSWLDKKTDFTFKTPLITYKNIEVLNAWVEQPYTKYLGKYIRPIWLSEQGLNSMDYSEKSLAEQAAGMAYAWKKIEDLKNIKGFQYHNWMDNRREGGLRIGLRRFPDDSVSPAGIKPIWEVFKAAGTKDEDSAFSFAKKIIGIDSWEDVKYKAVIGGANNLKKMRNLHSDTWVATDALGRSLPTDKETGPVKENKAVGIFYFLTHNNQGKPGPFNVTEIIKTNPQNPDWGANGSYYWGKPETGYYTSTDEAVIRLHAQLLADAGVDVIIFDCTNNLTYPEVIKTICKVFRQIRSEGESTPAIAFLASEKSVYKIWDQIYSKGLYADLWYQWKGKPLLLFGQWFKLGLMNDVEFPSYINDFFTIRNSWAWTTLAWYKNEGKDMWPWVDHYPQSIGWHDDKSKPEYVPVAVAEHPLSNIGRSYHNGKEPALNQFDLTASTGDGLFFQEQWQRALQVDPEFIFITGWNEWSAGKQVMKDNVQEALKIWDFFPGAKLGKVGKELKPGDAYFIDQYNQEFSRDIEPMEDGHTDNYYYQMMANIRNYKGTSEMPEATKMATINIKGSFEQWKNTGLSFYDHINDTKFRNAPGNYQAGPYVNTTGRNDIKEIKLVHDNSTIYFNVITNKDLTSYSGKNWMLIFIDADQNKATGWEGYDFVINKNVISATVTTISALDMRGNISNQHDLPMKITGNQVMIGVPSTFINAGKKINFDFHLADNIQRWADIHEFFINGDSAPSRRANYRYSGK